MVTGVASLGMSRMTTRAEQNTSFYQSEKTFSRPYSVLMNKAI